MVTVLPVNNPKFSRTWQEKFRIYLNIFSCFSTAKIMPIGKFASWTDGLGAPGGCL